MQAPSIVKVKEGLHLIIATNDGSTKSIDGQTIAIGVPLSGAAFHDFHASRMGNRLASRSVVGPRRISQRAAAQFNQPSVASAAPIALVLPNEF